MHQGLRFLKQGETASTPVPCDSNDTIVEELEEFADCIRGEAAPEVGGERATESLAVIRAGVKSAREGRAVDIAEILESDDE